jgi:hypothetical protein
VSQPSFSCDSGRYQPGCDPDHSGASAVTCAARCCELWWRLARVHYRAAFSGSRQRSDLFRYSVNCAKSPVIIPILKILQLRSLRNGQNLF